MGFFFYETPLFGGVWDNLLCNNSYIKGVKMKKEEVRKLLGLNASIDVIRIEEKKGEKG